jgi:hypothetical protein
MTQTIEAMRPLRALAEPFVVSGRLDPQLQAQLDEGLTCRDGCLLLVSQLHNIRRQNADAFGGWSGGLGSCDR